MAIIPKSKTPPNQQDIDILVNVGAPSLDSDEYLIYTWSKMLYSLYDLLNDEPGAIGYQA